jgi:N-acetylmuramoyl-L-alanine amidase-like protein
MAFNSVNLHFKTPSDFAAWLAKLTLTAWHPVGSTYHNTYRPTEAQWRGMASMFSMQATYVSKGWTTGPCCYLALHSPDPADDGIFVMTPPTVPGTHAGGCNPKRFGIEVVGDFQSKPPSAAQQQLLIDTVAALHRWAKIGPDLNAHRDCMADRTCPGDAFYALKPQLQQRLARALAPLTRYAAGPHGCIAQQDRRADAPAAKYYTPGEAFDADDLVNGYVHDITGIGFVPVGQVVRL